MPRDYKHRATSRKKRRKLSPWLGVVSGLLLGLFVAFLVFLKTQTPSEPPAFFQESPLPPVDETQPDSSEETRADSGVEPPSEGEEEIPRGTPLPPKPRFDFYTLLPEMEVVVPDEEVAPPPPAPPPQQPAATSTPPAQPEPASPAKTVAPAAPTTPARTVAPAASTAPARTATPAAESYLLQVGSFRNGEQAERFKAQLAMLGLQTSIQKVTIDNKDTYHRVHVGPFHDTGSLNNVRSRLSKQGIESRIIKIRK